VTRRVSVIGQIGCAKVLITMATMHVFYSDLVMQHDNYFLY
jgi:hypothetical protein